MEATPTKAPEGAEKLMKRCEALEAQIERARWLIQRIAEPTQECRPCSACRGAAEAWLMADAVARQPAINSTHVAVRRRAGKPPRFDGEIVADDE